MSEPDLKPKSFFAWLFSWRMLRRCLLSMAVLITILALAGVEETWRGKRAWDQFRAELQAKGDSLDFKSLYPPIPDDQNFAISPVWNPLLKYETNPATHLLEWRGAAEMNRQFVAISRTNNQGDPLSSKWQLARRADLAGWQTYYRTPNKRGEFEFPTAPNPGTPAQDILLALSRFDTNIALLRASASRPLSRYPLNYESGFPMVMPHFPRFRAIVSFLHLRIDAELADNQTENAFEDLRLMIRTVDSLRGEPTLISHLVYIPTLNLEVQAVWDGLAGHQWSEEQLTVLERDLGKVDLLQSYKTAMRGERACAVASMDNMRQGLMPAASVNDEALEPVYERSRLAAALSPLTGWFYYRNELAIARAETKWIDAASLKAADQAKNQAAFSVGRRTPYNILAALLIPAIDRTITKTTLAQGGVDLARAACALERFRLANNSYPENLQSLVPKFIDSVPLDLVNGQPLKYQRTDNGLFVLYSVGWNQTDDGGYAAMKPRGKSGDQINIDPARGDWVWAYEPRVK